ncbi:hypothetical protein [Coleofasciculus sp. FACHB-T130]|uniref:hypothetical protein n=1 Tax=Cyanophyceae TaxID=3028117 RepID=UPI00168839E7|nr:hypothetical protein [Coleofasciculus sp. FACHB-T130]MBD1880530.1 hypothetical protein [Coleofasciculus sp. FACHB-T130]
MLTQIKTSPPQSGEVLHKFLFSPNTSPQSSVLSPQSSVLSPQSSVLSPQFSVLTKD